MSDMITAEEILNKMGQGIGVVFLDCRFKRGDKNYGSELYEKEHIAGAFHVDFVEDLSRSGGGQGGDHPMLTPEAFKDLLESFGAKDESLIVAYDDGNLMVPSRVVFQGRLSGIESIRVLAGGLAAWKAAGGSIESGRRDRPGGGRLTINPSKRLAVDISFVKEYKDRDEILLIDCRPKDHYLGKKKPNDGRAGHIPGAKCYFAGDIVENGRLKDRDFLDNYFKDLRQYDQVITSCGSGGLCCIVNMALSELGINHLTYPGGFSEWISDPHNEVSTKNE